MTSVADELVLKAIPLNAADYAPYGDVIAVDPEKPFSPANFGRAKRYNWLSNVRNLRENARLNMCIFSYTTREQSPLKLILLERHEYSTQVFLPMSSSSSYLTVVALGDEQPDLDSIRAFVVTGGQGISYHPGIWHYPMTVIGEPMDLACIVYEDETKDDCEIWKTNQSIVVTF